MSLSAGCRISETILMHRQAIIVAMALMMALLSARGADLVVWWDKGYYAQEEAAARDPSAAFEQKTGSQVELAFHEQREAVEAAQPPDFAWGFWLSNYVAPWVLEELH